jgi:Ca-activated chloride channel family protein
MIVNDDKKLPEMISLKLRYKNLDDSTSKLIERIVVKQSNQVEQASENLRFAAAVAEFGMLLRKSEYKKNASYESVKKLATSSLGKDVEGYRKEFLSLLDKTMLLDKTARK